jgi:hypothetical protein
MKKPITILTLLGVAVLSLHAAEFTSSSDSITQKIKAQHNFAYQGSFPTYEGQIIDWELDDVDYTLVPIDEYSNTLKIRNEGASKKITTIIPINDKVKNIAISMAAAMLEKPSSPLSGFNIGFEIKDQNGEIIKSIPKAIYKKGVESPWETYNYITDIPKTFKNGEIIITINLLGSMSAQVQNILVSELSTKEWGEIAFSKNKKNQNTRSSSINPTVKRNMAEIMKETKYIEMIWRARRPNRANESEFYIHYIQGAMKLTDNDTDKKIRQRNLTIGQLSTLANQARKKAGLPEVKFK